MTISCLDVVEVKLAVVRDEPDANFRLSRSRANVPAQNKNTNKLISDNITKQGSRCCNLHWKVWKNVLLEALADETHKAALDAVVRHVDHEDEGWCVRKLAFLKLKFFT